MKLHPGQLVLIDHHGLRLARVRFAQGDTAYLELQGYFLHTIPVDVPVDEVKPYHGQETDHAGRIVK